MTVRVIDQFLRFGTTAFAAYATVHHASAQAAIAAVHSRGLRGAVGQVLLVLQSQNLADLPHR